MRYFNACCFVAANFPQKVLGFSGAGPHKKDVFQCRPSSCSFLFSFGITTAAAYLNEPLIHAQTHAVIPQLNPSIGWDKDMMTI